ncbi:MAG: hypothetical protein ACRD2I_17265 [Vicinamibacterales bacterium]
MHTALLVRHRRWGLTAILGVVATWAIGAGAQVPQTPRSTLPLTPQRERGASITPAYEGWFENADGSFSMLIGYYNRNAKEALDIPIGPNNRVAPGVADQGQPTHFEIGRQWGVFVVKVPKDFGTKVITWTIVANGETQTIPFTLNKGYPISPYKELGMGNQPPVLAFSEGGAKVTGPPTAVAAEFTGAVNTPLPISVWVEDPKAPGAAESPLGRGFSPSVATISLHKFRGPGKVTFDKARIPVTKQGERVSIAASFEAAGDYLLRVQANDESGEGGAGFQCCWTNTYVKVAVRP